MTKTLSPEKWLVAATVLVLTVAIYAHTFALYASGWHAEENMHGVAVVPLVAFLIWMGWPRLRTVPVRPNVVGGLAVLIPAVLIQVAGIWMGLERSIGFAFVLAVIGLVLYFGGTALTRALSFPLSFLFFMVPSPGGFIDMVSAPLELLSARMAVILAGLAGVGVERRGVELVIPAKGVDLQVAVGCSGIHSLTAMCMLAALLAYFMTIPTVYKWVLFALGVPLALLGNIIRIFCVVMIANAHGQAAGLAFHDGPVGKLVPFLTAFLILMGLGRLIEWRLSRDRTPPGPTSEDPPPVSKTALSSSPDSSLLSKI